MSDACLTSFRASVTGDQLGADDQSEVGERELGQWVWQLTHSVVAGTR